MLEITYVLPIEEQNENITELFSMLKKLDPVPKILQSEKLTIVMVKYLSDEVIQRFPVTTSQISSLARIISNSDSENGVIKILERRSIQLEDAERDVTKAFAAGQNIQPYSQPSDYESIVQRPFKRLKND